MTRRDLLRRSLVAGLAPLLRISSQQDSTRPGRADPLYDPSMVQERAATTAADNDPVVKGLEQRLKCTCGCNLDIYTCRTTDFTCTYSPALHREVVALLGAGSSSDAVVAAFVDRYGESILMAPPPQGFNLAGYLVPGLVVAVVGLLLALVLVRRGRRLAPATAPADAGNLQVHPNPVEEERLRRALAEVED